GLARTPLPASAPEPRPLPRETRPLETRSSLQRTPVAAFAPRATAAEAPPSVPAATEAPSRATHGKETPPQKYQLVAIGTSTGGPVALQRVLMGLPARVPAPIVLVQHMPQSFTPAFAERLNKLCNIQ